MLRILRAFAWMRWRVLVNSLERTGARDTLQRLSLAVEQIGPILAAALLIPSAISLAVISSYSGYALARAPVEHVLSFELLRFLLLAAVGLSVLGPVVLPAREQTNAVRLLLLPIPRPVLYLAQTASALADPWILLVVPIVAGLPVGLAAGGAPGRAVIAFAAGGLLLVVLLGLSSVATLVLHLVMRDRRRGELLALLFVVVLPLLGVLPGLMQNDGALEPVEGPSRRSDEVPAWMRNAGTRAFAFVPSELFHDAVSRPREHPLAAAGAPLLLLTLMGLGLHALGLLASARMLGSPPASGSRRAAGQLPVRTIRLPGLSAGASAVAVNQLRLAWRTPRGRSIFVSPLLVFAMFAVVMWRGGGGGDFGFIEIESGLALAVFGSAVCLLAILPFAMNQFAIDRAGLTMQFLSPLSEVEMLAGKAAGNGLVVLAPALLCVLLSRLAFPGGSAALWLSIPLSVIAAYLLAAPAAGALSAIFPRAVDLNSIGSGSNAHGLAGLLGMLAFVAAGVPPVVLVLLATRGIGRPALAPVLLLIWCGAAGIICRALLALVARLVHARRENLAMVV